MNSAAEIRPFLFPVIAGITVIGLIASLFSAVPSIVSGRKELIGARTRRGQLTAKAEALANIDESAQNETLKAALTALPITLPYRQALALLDQLSADRRVGINVLKITEEESALVLQFDAMGELSDLTGFLLDFQTVLPIASLRAVDVSRAAVQSGFDTGYYQATMVARINWQDTPESIGKSTDPLPILSGKFLEIRELLKQYHEAPRSSADISSDRAPSLFAP